MLKKVLLITVACFSGLSNAQSQGDVDNSSQISKKNRFFGGDRFPGNGGQFQGNGGRFPGNGGRFPGNGNGGRESGRDYNEWNQGAGRDEWGSNNHHGSLFHPCEFFHPAFDRYIACVAVGHHYGYGYHRYRSIKRIRRGRGACYRAERRAAFSALRKCEYGTFGDICRVVRCVVR